MKIPSGSLLALENVPTLSELLDATLRFAGYPLPAAWDRQPVVNRNAVEPPALISNDNLMPPMYGFALTHPLRSNSKRRSLPILILSDSKVTREQVYPQSPCSRH